MTVGVTGTGSTREPEFEAEQNGELPKVDKPGKAADTGTR